ncbi:hypothetical protein AKO1_008740 [Acrasis kona]|uniref:Ras-GAP domain-containing protein n=1 Tax=Acrasis kona TaxID=1008807 RepID=A0AAW2ZDZ8_9EUKA
MPPQLRIVSSYIAEVSDSLQLDTPVLIGGFIILRFFNPAIAAPDIFLGPNVAKKRNKNAQRNLILISKIIQNLANGVVFGNKEKYMISMNEFLVSKREDMRNYLLSVIDKDFSSTATREEVLRPTHEEGINLDKYEQNDLSKLHKIFLESSKSIASFFLSDGAKQVKTVGHVMNDCLNVIHLAKDMGIEQSDEALIYESMNNTIYRIKDRIDASSMENKFVFYRGKQSRERQPVFYLIASRITEDMVQDEFGSFLYIILKTLGKLVENVEWCLIVDMSNVNPSSAQRAFATSVLEKLLPFINPLATKNLVNLFVVHATNFKTNLFELFKNAFKILMPNVSTKDSTKKLIEINQWTQLLQYIRPSNILLPEESKAIVPDSYRVVKINPKGKRQDRIIKLTPKSILNIDPKNNSIKNERLLAEVEEVSAPQNNLEVHMKFRPIPNSNMKPSSPNSGHQDQEDLLDDSVFRRYIVNTEKERSDLLEDLFETTVQSQFIDTAQAFQITETCFLTEDEGSEHRTSKRSDRVYKLTNDSILVVDKRLIKTEIPFIAIEYCKPSPDQRDTVILKVKYEEHERLITCEARSKQVEDSILDGMRRAVERIRIRSLAEPESDGEGEEEEEIEDNQLRDDLNDPILNDNQQEEQSQPNQPLVITINNNHTISEDPLLSPSTPIKE